MKHATVLVLAAALALVGCVRSVPPLATSTARPPLQYDEPRAWICRADLTEDPCRSDLDATVVSADGTRQRAPFAAPAEPSVDCFYVYPTVDMGILADNHDDFSDTTRMREVTRAQVARFSRVCRVFAPLYRQVSIGTYFASADTRERRLAVAFSDVLLAFRWYLAHADPSRPIALVGHSQGAEMIVRLVRAFFDADPAMRARLLVAMPIGGDVDVADGKTTGGTFQSVPLCTSADERGCVVAFRTYSAARDAKSWDGPPPKGRRTACVNPANVGGNEPRPLASAVFPTRSQYHLATPGAESIATPFVVFPALYSARCADGLDGFRYLAITRARASGDARQDPVDFDAPIFRSRLGLHVLDFQLAQDDLVELIARKASVALR